MCAAEEFRDEALAMWLAAARAATSQERDEYARMALAYEALARSSVTNVLAATGWLGAHAA